MRPAAGSLLAAFTGEHVGEPRLLIALYGPPLLHLDIKAVELSDLSDRVEDAVVLWERDGAVRARMAVTTAAWPAPDPHWIEDRFWVRLHYGAAKVGARRAVRVPRAADAAALGPLIALGHGQRPQGVRRIEDYAPELVAAMASTIGEHSRAGCTAALRAAAELYRQLRAHAAVGSSRSVLARSTRHSRSSTR